MDATTTTALWPQGIGGVVKHMESSSRPIERRTRPQKDQALNCPRCNSTNTKFCYYNNYSLSQPRYFCKTCRRYWTEGGSLRNVPVGGGSRKNKRSSSSSLISSSKKLVDLPDLTPQIGFLHHYDHQYPNKIHHGQDLNLGYPPPPSTLTDQDQYGNMCKLAVDVNGSKTHFLNPNTSSSSSSMDQLLKSGVSSRGLMLASFMSMQHQVSDSNTVIYPPPNVFPFQELKPTLNFCLEGFESNSEYVSNSGARILFPVEDLKQVPSNTATVTTTTTSVSQFVDHQQNRGQGLPGDTNGFWNGILGGSYIS